MESRWKSPSCGARRSCLARKSGEQATGAKRSKALRLAAMKLTMQHAVCCCCCPNQSPRELVALLFLSMNGLPMSWIVSNRSRTVFPDRWGAIEAGGIRTGLEENASPKLGGASS